MTRRAKPAPEPPQDHIVQRWPMKRRYWSLHTPGIRTAAAMDLHLPPVQRGAAWSPDRQLAFARSVWAGVPMPPLIVLQARRLWLLDGQQRATALGLTVLRAGVRVDRPRMAWDWTTNEWSHADDGGATLAGFAATPVSSLHGLDRDEFVHTCVGLDECICLQVPMLILQWSPDVGAVLPSILRSLTAAGVPWTDAELERLGSTWDPADG